MPKPKRPRPPVIKTDWVVTEIIGRSGQLTITYVADTKSELKAMLARMPRCMTEVIERKWRKVDL